MQILKQNVCGKDIVRIGTDKGIDWSDELTLEFGEYRKNLQIY